MVNKFPAVEKLDWSPEDKGVSLRLSYETIKKLYNLLYDFDALEIEIKETGRKGVWYFSIENGKAEGLFIEKRKEGGSK